MTIRALAVGNNNINQADHRALISALTQPKNSLNHRPGFFPASSVGTLTNVSAMTVGVGAFKAVVPNDDGSGYYLVQNDSQINLNFDPGEAGTTRTDRIIVRVYNNAQDGSGKDGAFVEYLKGQSSGSATPLPSNSLLMWDVPVPAGASSGGGGINFTSIAVDKRVYTTASGGLIPVANATEMNAVENPFEGMAVYNKVADVVYIYDGSLWRPRSVASVPSASNLATNIVNPDEGALAWVKDFDIIYAYDGSKWVAKGQVTVPTSANLTSILNPYEGLVATTADTDTKYTYSGGAWVKEKLVQAGQATVSFSANNFGSVVVNFPKAFASQPSVVAMLTTSSGAANGSTVRATTQSTTSVTIGVTLSAAQTTSLTVNWIAVEI